MPASIKFDGTELLNATYVPGFAAHESAPDREIVRLPNSRGDGSAFVSSRYGEKRVRVDGTLVGDDMEDLEEKVDAFKELLSREQKELAIGFAGGTRTYVATCESHAFSRRPSDIMAVAWTAVFLVPTGEGLGPDTEVLVDDGIPFSAYVAPVAKTVTFTGSRDPKPVITVIPNGNWASAKGVMVRNAAGEAIMVPLDMAWLDGRELVIDCELRKVTSNMDGNSLYPERRFYGVFPRFEPGANAVEFLFGSLPIQGTRVDDPTELSVGDNLESANSRVAVSFELPQTEATIQQVKMVATRTGSPIYACEIRIETDDGDKPSGNLVDPAATVYDFTSVPSGTKAWKTARFASAFTLQSNTRYWLVIKPSGVTTLNGSNYDTFWGGMEYSRGRTAKSTDSGATWPTATQVAFEIDAGGTSASIASAAVVVDYKPRYL